MDLEDWKFFNQLKEKNISKNSVVWNPEYLEGFQDALKSFIDRTTGYAYEFDLEGNISVSDYLMSFNMYEQKCWSCNQKIEAPKHARRCFFCKKCCTLPGKKHPNPHV